MSSDDSALLSSKRSCGKRSATTETPKTHNSVHFATFFGGVFVGIVFLKFSNNQMLRIWDYDAAKYRYSMHCNTTQLSHDEFLDIVLFRKTVYNDFDGADFVDLGYAFQSHVFEEIFKNFFNSHPSQSTVRIIEVGSWAGRSAINMAKICAKLAPDRICSIIAIDPWTGTSINYEFVGIPRTKNGNINIYEVFMNNVKNASLHRVITPFRITAAAGAHTLFCFNVTADLIYIDGDHEYQEVLNDITAFYALLNPTGTIFGDDYTMEGVADAITEFAKVAGERFDFIDDTWIMNKTRQIN